MVRLMLSAFLFLLLNCTANAARVIFYLHGRIVEEMGPGAVETTHGYGAYEYDNIIAAFRKEGFAVVSECRPKGTDVKVYAHKVARQVDSLLKAGYQPGDITIIGASKGALIAQYAATYIHNPAVNFVFMGGCGVAIEASNPEINYCGNILSVFEASDEVGGSCTPTKLRSVLEVPHFKELKLNTGLQHGFLYRPLKDWVTPAIRWAKGLYN